MLDNLISPSMLFITMNNPTEINIIRLRLIVYSLKTFQILPFRVVITYGFGPWKVLSADIDGTNLPSRYYTNLKPL